jgi:hypothetical protein
MRVWVVAPSREWANDRSKKFWSFEGAELLKLTRTGPLAGAKSGDLGAGDTTASAEAAAPSVVFRDPPKSGAIDRG